MKAYYCCEDCKRKYDTAEKAIGCEQSHAIEREKAELIKESKKKRKDEIKALVVAYVNDYDEYPFSYLDMMLGFNT